MQEQNDSLTTTSSGSLFTASSSGEPPERVGEYPAIQFPDVESGWNCYQILDLIGMCHQLTPFLGHIMLALRINSGRRGKSFDRNRLKQLIEF